MTIFTNEEVYLGAGAFEHGMRTQTTIPGVARKTTPGVAIGILAAGIRSGLPADLFERMIDQNHHDDAHLLKRLLAKFEGNDWSIDLWHRLPAGKYKLCTDLCRPNLSGWRYDPSSQADDA